MNKQIAVSLVDFKDGSEEAVFAGRIAEHVQNALRTAIRVKVQKLEDRVGLTVYAPLNNTEAERSFSIAEIREGLRQSLVFVGLARSISAELNDRIG